MNTHQKVSSCLQKIDLRAKQNNELLWEKYVQLGSKIVRLLCYSKEFIPLIQKQLSYVLSDVSKNYDATIILWNEKNIESFLEQFIDLHIKSRMRLQQLATKNKNVEFEITNNKNITKIGSSNGIMNNFELLDISYSKHNPLIRINSVRGIVEAYDSERNIYYYGVKDLHPEEFIKQGHIFVQIFNKIAKTANSNLVHAAVVGLNNNGVLLCARGQRGKSTLAVLAMMHGCDYVSDDYLILEKEGDELYSYPIYSIVTLSAKMYNEIYDDLKGKFVSNNARRDKYVIDIKAYHESFRNKYPIKICIFPKIVDDEKPSISPCKKGQAITQLVHSTISQMEDKHDIETIKKLINFVGEFDFYQMNLCSDIRENAKYLKKFCSQIINTTTKI